MVARHGFQGVTIDRVAEEAKIAKGTVYIRLSRSKVLAQEEQAETQAYIKGSQKGGGFGMTLGDLLKQKHKG